MVSILWRLEDMKENQLGENISKFRKAKGLSQEKVAEVLEVSRQAVTKWERLNAMTSVSRKVWR